MRAVAALGLASLSACSLIDGLGGNSNNDTDAGLGDGGFSAWKQKADMLTTRSAPAVASVDGLVFAIAGTNAGATGYLAVNEAYDPVADSWSNRELLTLGRMNRVGASVVDGRIYFIGGLFPLPPGGSNTASCARSNERYDLGSDMWESRTDLPQNTCGHGVGVVGSRIFLMGGYFPAQPYPGLFIYDTLTDTWSVGAPMLTPRYWTSTAVIDGIIYVIGGMVEAGIVDDVEAYNPATDSWTVEPRLPTPRNETAAAVVNGKIIVAGGTGGQGPTTNVDQYDPVARTWSKLPDLPFKWTAAGAIALGNTFLMMGGTTDSQPEIPSVYALTIE